MSFNSDKKREHEASAQASLQKRDYGSAFFHTAKAAEFGLKLAEESPEPIARKYVEDALELIDIAGSLREKARTAPRPADPPVRQRTTEVSADGSAGAEAGAVPENQWELKDKPKERLSDVVGLEEVKAELREKVIEPFRHPELFERFKLKPGGGVLMYGPPGNGKTFIARAVAGELDAAFFPVNVAQIKDKYVGETEKNLQKLFDAARSHERSVLFLDEVDHLLAKRGNRKVGAVAQFLTLADGFVSNEKCILILAATNKPWMLDEAVTRPGRLGTHIYVGPPDAKAREGILGISLKGVPVDSGVVTSVLAEKTNGYSGADLTELCDRAKRGAKNRQSTTGKDELVTMEDFTVALEKIKPSVTPEQIEEYQKWRDAGLKPSDADGDDD